MVGVRQCVSGFEAVDRALAVDQTKATGSSTWDLRAARAVGKWWRRARPRPWWRWVRIPG
jgi:hypothetical protein